MSRPRGSGGTWRDRQERDPFVQQARRAGWRSRAVFKLEEIARKEKLLRRGMLCVDLGAAPGGWSQYVSERLDGDVRIVAVDMLPMDALPSVEFIQGDFTEEAVCQALKDALGGTKADLVMSDMAPNISGNRAVDQPKSMRLAELALETARALLRPGGNLICKLFQGEGSDAFMADARSAFDKVRIVKPKASRPGSREVYLMALGLSRGK